MKNILFIVSMILLVTSSCTSQKQLISETPKTTRVAEIYDNKVVIITKTTITKEHYEKLIAARKARNGDY
tara:strand:- start:5634 stop:5843 length:210 start_codon:yes stop_codon:yes gene_type:complete